MIPKYVCSDQRDIDTAMKAYKIIADGLMTITRELARMQTNIRMRQPFYDALEECWAAMTAVKATKLDKSG